MTITLQSNDRFNDFGEFDTETKRLSVYSESESPQWKDRIAGWFATVGHSVALIFHVEHKLYFVHGDNSFPLEDDARARIEGGQTKRKFTLEQSGRPLISIDYQVPAPVVDPELDFTQTHPEDFDFLLFVRNVLNSPHRRKLAQGFRDD